MRSCLRVALVLAVCSVGVSVVCGQDSPDKSKAKVELRWVESHRIAGLTEDEGFQSTCDPNSIVYPHKQPALVLTASEVTEVRLTNLDLSAHGLSSENYMVKILLTQEARDKLAASCEGSAVRRLTVVVDGKCWGLRCYNKVRDERLAPAATRAASFAPEVGYFSSKSEAERLVDALK